MPILVALHHRTTYRYDRLVSLGPQSVRLRPAPHCASRILSYALHVEPRKHFLNWQQDPQSNWIARLVFPEKTSRMSVEVDLVVEMTSRNPFDFFLEPSAEQWPFAYEAALAEDLRPYRKEPEPSPLFDAFVGQLDTSPRHTADLLVSINQAVADHIRYTVRLEPGLQTPEETLEKRAGSCRDSGWLLVQILRRLGFAARFASGYLVQLTADEKPLEGPEGPAADFVDLHAWCEVYLPGAGWIGLDPTSGLLAGEGHLPLACAAEPSMAAPIAGALDACEATFEHVMTVTRIKETPRVTKPFDDESWRAVMELGERIDGVLEANDVRLTMGGEPTFVSIDDPDGDEWNTAALGTKKRELAVTLFHRLRERYAPNGFVHFGQGKWYPGEPLPRWALSLFWRNDGEPIWKDPALLADERAPSGADVPSAERLLRAVAARLGIAPARVFPAYEDAYYYLWRERRLPRNVDPRDAKLTDPLERERLRRLLGEGLGAPVGHVLPIDKPEGAARFRSSSWHFRDGHCWLSPGDSPIGLRLPLDAQPWAEPEDLPARAERDPSVVPGALAGRDELGGEPPPPPAPSEAIADRPPEIGESAAWIVRLAMCAEPRDGTLYVFMPPLERLEDYLELVAAVEAAAAEVGVPVMMEGYPPPRDPRLSTLSVTPDPGVIEVNIVPARRWEEIVERTEHLYGIARASRLSAEKFMHDGRHVGTGGGNHVVLGGVTPEDSPFLRRPDLLRSLIGYVHQHPSLSYLFSGLFIGPTSQAPRVDEARNDALYELEIAFAEVERAVARAGDAPPPPWLSDRIFRDLLTDVTGNTHRAEFCIDKLFSPSGATGRLGLLELRGFEMPPHARMNLAQTLLLRGLVATFWETPFAPERLTRWGTELHDRFMLPFFVWQDFEDVIRDLQRAGLAFDARWFLPQFEFRFPRVGDVQVQGIDLELRTALEPWHVMGEDATATGTARYVDSSLERLQVRVTGMASDRFQLTCNQRALPLRPSGVVGEFVCGVRFRAWQPPRCLHPNIPVQAPLVFDLIDTWTGRSMGGATYHVSHPGGRSHDTRPVNALEAEGRQRARFFRGGHTPGTVSVAPSKANPDHPFTLDLRRA